MTVKENTEANAHCFSSLFCSFLFYFLALVEQDKGAGWLRRAVKGAIYWRRVSARVPARAAEPAEKHREVRRGALTSKHKQTQAQAVSELCSPRDVYTKTHQFTKTGSGQT